MKPSLSRARWKSERTSGSLVASSVASGSQAMRSSALCLAPRLRVAVVMAGVSWCGYVQPTGSASRQPAEAVDVDATDQHIPVEVRAGDEAGGAGVADQVARLYLIAL